MKKRIFAGLALVALSVAGCRGTAVGTTVPAAAQASSSAASAASAASAVAAASSSATAPAGATLASSYSVSFESAAGVTSTGSLTNISLDDEGEAFGSLVNAPGFPGTNAVSGELVGGELTLSINLANALYGTVNPANGQISGTYTGLALGQGTWTATPLTETPPTPTPTPTPTSSQSLNVDAGPNQTILGTNVISLDGQVTGGAAGVAWTQVSGPGTTTFASPGSAATTAKVSTPGTYVFQLTAEGDGTSASGQVTITVQAYVALGDSYSAGDGAGDYLAGSTDSHCLQSANAYPELVDAKVAGANAVPAGTANPAFVFGACTGAEIPDFNSPQNANQPAQLSYLENLPAKSVGLVTLTIGGNDAGFGQVMEYCAERKPTQESCQEHSQAEVNDIILKQLALNLFALYEQIKSEPSLAPNAQILVLGYPQFFPAGQATSCSTGFLSYEFQPSDMAWIDSAIKLVDNDIQASANAAGLTYVDTSNAFAGHQLCQSDPDLNDVVISPVLYLEGYSSTIQSFHPNAAGQRDLAQNASASVSFPTS